MATYFITRERKNEIKDIVIDIIKKSDIHALPVRINNILKQYKIRCIKMDKIALRSSRQGSVASDDGYIIKSGDEYVIVYNPNHSRQRIRYTFACQLAHIFLGHILADKSDKATDVEAAYFADELLMPLSVLDSYGDRSAKDIALRCDVSLAAARIREKDFVRRDKYKKINGETPYDIKFLNCFFAEDKEEDK